MENSVHSHKTHTTLKSQQYRRAPTHRNLLVVASSHNHVLRRHPVDCFDASLMLETLTFDR